MYTDRFGLFAVPCESDMGNKGGGPQYFRPLVSSLPRKEAAAGCFADVLKNCQARQGMTENTYCGEALRPDPTLFPMLAPRPASTALIAGMDSGGSMPDSGAVD